MKIINFEKSVLNFIKTQFDCLNGYFVSYLHVEYRE